jgi:hypothetical protein
MENLELRMYGLVNYQLTGIQQGIQFLHAVVEYGQSVKWTLGTHKLDQYNEWADQHKTVILLNGGTTNTNEERLGTMNQHLQTLKSKGIYSSWFNEPDLGDQLTAIAFIVDERVFNKEKYPDFDFTNKNQITPGYGMWSEDPLNPQFMNENEKLRWDFWVEFIGGETNLWLRTWLKNFRLA